MNTDIPKEIEDRYEGKWIAWDTETSEVAGAGETLDAAIEQSRAAREAGHVMYYHHILPADMIIVGGL